MPLGELSHTLRIRVGGTPLRDDVTRQLVSASVEDDLVLPAEFIIVFRDPDRTVLADTRIDIGADVDLAVVSGASPREESLLVAGRVTALEAEFDPSGTLTVVRGYDPSHRALAGRRTVVYRNASYSDIVKEVVRRTGLRPGRVEATRPVFDHVTQCNQSDWGFLRQLAREVGFDVRVEAGRVDFHRPADAATGPPVGQLGSTDPLQLTLHEDLLRLRCSLTATQQVNQVEVRGWDVTTKRAVVGRADPSSTAASLGVNPGAVASRLGRADHVVAHSPLQTQQAVEVAARAASEEIGSSFGAVDGVARGNPKLRAGTAVSVGLVGSPFDGRYTLSTARHVFDEDGYTTWFTVSGRHDRSLLGLATGGANSEHRPSAIPGVVPALVTNSADPEDQCRVKLKFPWLDDSYETDWVRTSQLWAGKGYGAVVVPEVGDEVLVAFDHGDIQRPYVLGGLYNGKDLPADVKGLVNANGKVTKRQLRSRKGHALTITESDRLDSVTLVTAEDHCGLELDETKKSTTLRAAGELRLAGKTISMVATDGVTIDGGAKIEVKAKQVEINGETKGTFKAKQVEINGESKGTFKGMALEINGSTKVVVKGGVVQIN